MKRFRPLLVMGTRPEAIKMAPVVAACRDRVEAIEPLVCFTGQHDEMLWQVADYFAIEPDFDLKVMSPGQSLAQLTARLLIDLDATLVSARPDCVVAQGDTTSARDWLRHATSLAPGRPVGRDAADLLRGVDKSDH